MEKNLEKIIPLTETRIPLKLFKKGKVRETFEYKEDELIMVASDRLSAFDVVFNEGIPLKGIILTQLSYFWFSLLKAKNHIISKKPPKDLQKYPELNYRTMHVKKIDILPIECVVRGYLAGSGWKDYQGTGGVCGIKLPSGMKQSEKLPKPIFTPATKAETGHDLNINKEEAGKIIKDKLGMDLIDELEEKAIEIYSKANEYANSKGIIIADTKFEFGLKEGELILADEVLTPDSSRFWVKKLYKVGEAQASLDKQYIRDYLETLNWNKQPPPPPLPKEIVINGAKKYMEIYKILTGKEIWDVIK